MTKKRQSRIKKDWKSAQSTSHNIDTRIVSLVKFLARQAAERDYKKLLKEHESHVHSEDAEGPK